MAVELETKIMNQIGLFDSYQWNNGSGSCGYLRSNAVSKLASVAKENGLDIAPKWLNHCRTALQVDEVNSGRFGLTNTWIACSYAIQDAIYRSEGGDGITPVENWHFWSDKQRNEWNRRQMPHGEMMHRFGFVEKKG